MWANVWDVFHRTPSRGGRGRPAAVNFVVRFGCGGFFGIFFVFFFFFFFERTRPATGMRPPCLIYLSTINRVFAICLIMLGWETRKYYYETEELPNPTPTQPKENWVKSGIWNTFSHSNYLFVGWDWFYIGNRRQET